MHNNTSLQIIKSHTDTNSIPAGLIHVSQNVSINALVSRIGKYLNEDFYVVSNANAEENETVIHFNGKNYTFLSSDFLYPQFAVIQTLKRLLADKYNCFLHQSYLKESIYALLIVKKTVLNSFLKEETFWFDKNFALLQDGYDGFAELNALQSKPKPKPDKQTAKSSSHFETADVLYSEWKAKNTMNGFPKWGLVALAMLFTGVGIFGYVLFHKTNGTWVYKSRAWSNRFSFLEFTPDKIEASQLEKYVGTLVDIPSGTFAMGHEATKEIADAHPVHDVNLKGFQMMDAEVTFEQWDACVADGACTEKPDDEGWGRGEKPVINISYNDILDEYLPWLYEKTGYKFELPNEAQWEYAARGGTKTFYAFGDTVKCGEGNFGKFYSRKRYERRNNYCINSDLGRRTVLIKQYAPNAYGLYDMHGNVSELVADQYEDTYKKAKVDGTPRFNLAIGEYKEETFYIKVPIRGGDFSTSKTDMHVAKRFFQSTGDAWKNVGFRLVLNNSK